MMYCSCVQKTALHSTAGSKTTRLNKSEYFRVFFWWEIENICGVFLWENMISKYGNRKYDFFLPISRRTLV